MKPMQLLPIIKKTYYIKDRFIHDVINSIRNIILDNKCKGILRKFYTNSRNNIHKIIFNNFRKNYKYYTVFDRKDLFDYRHEHVPIFYIFDKKKNYNEDIFNNMMFDPIEKYFNEYEKSYVGCYLNICPLKHINNFDALVTMGNSDKIILSFKSNSDLAKFKMLMV